METLNVQCIPSSQLSASYVFSQSFIAERDVSDLLWAQKVVESQWLGEFPTLAVINEGQFKEPIQLFEDVHLIPSEEWGLLDDTDVFLINKKMSDILGVGGSEGSLFDLSYAHSEALLDLFERVQFVVVCVGKPSERFPETAEAEYE